MENNKSYSALFSRYGSPSREADIRISGYLTRPDYLDTFDRIKHQDETAARIIADCKRLVSQLIEYRQDLAARYSALATMPSRESIELQRYRGYHGGVTYYIRFWTQYDDGTRVKTATETYSGKERHKAIARFEELKKQRPGIEAEKRIEKQQWEK